MAKVEEKGRPNSEYSRFDKYDTAVLEAILQADFDAPEAEQMDMEQAFYISNLIAERKGTKHKDVATAKAEFFEYYYPLVGEEDTLYEFDDDVLRNNAVKNSEANVSIWLKNWRRFASAAAVFVLLMFSGTVTAYALGYNPFLVRAVWDDEQFWFEKDVPTFEMLQAVSQYDYIDNLIPKWLPEGYKFDKIETEKNDLRIDIDAIFVKEIAEQGQSEMLHIGCLYLNNYKKSFYEKDAANVVTYSSHNTDYFIMTDKEYITVVWNSGNTEYYFSGKISIEDVEKMIDSIY